MYCERCHRLTEGEICPECGKPCKREALPDDPCLLLSGGQIWVDMACEVLDQEKVPYLKQGELGAAMTVITGLATETYHLYVPFQYYDRAQELTQGIVPSPDEAAEDVSFEEEPGTECEQEEDE